MGDSPSRSSSDNSARGSIGGNDLLVELQVDGSSSKGVTEALSELATASALDSEYESELWAMLCAVRHPNFSQPAGFQAYQTAHDSMLRLVRQLKVLDFDRCFAISASLVLPGCRYQWFILGTRQYLCMDE